MSSHPHIFIVAVLAALLFVPSGVAAAGNAGNDARKTARELKKQGWKTLAGKDDLETQILTLYARQLETDGGFPRYVVETRTATGRDYPSARKQALSFARADIAAGMESEVASLCELMTGNRMLSGQESEAVSTLAATARITVQQNIGSTAVLVEIYRDLPDGNVEVRISLSYDTAAIRKDIAGAVGVSAEEQPHKEI